LKQKVVAQELKKKQTIESQKKNLI